MADLKCPGCGAKSVAGQDGRRICPECGGSFEFVAGEAKLAGVAEFDQLKKTVDDQAAEISALKEQLGQAEPAAEPPTEPETDDEDDDDEDGF